MRRLRSAWSAYLGFSNGFALVLFIAGGLLGLAVNIYTLSVTGVGFSCVILTIGWLYLKRQLRKSHYTENRVGVGRRFPRGKRRASRRFEEAEGEQYD